MARNRKRRKLKNPLPTLKTSKEEILEAIRYISENAKVGIDESVLGPNDPEDPQQFFTPVNLVLHSVEPQMQRKMLDLLLSQEEPFYRGVIDELEQESPHKYSDGRVPPEWLQDRVRAGRTTNVLRDKFKVWTEVDGPKPATYEEFLEKINFGTSKSRKMRRRYY